MSDHALRGTRRTQEPVCCDWTTFRAKCGAGDAQGSCAACIRLVNDTHTPGRGGPTCSVVALPPPISTKSATAGPGDSRRRRVLRLKLQLLTADNACRGELSRRRPRVRVALAHAGTRVYY